MTRLRKSRKAPISSSSHLNLVAGINSVRILLNIDRIKEIWIREGSRETKLDNLISVATSKGISVLKQSQKEFDAKIPQNSKHQGVLAVAIPRNIEAENKLSLFLDNRDKPLVLVLDGVTDPHNFGACLRSAVAFGVTCVVIPKDNSAPLNEVARKTSSGASELIPVVRVVNLARCLRRLKGDGFWVVGAVGQSSVGIQKAFDDRPTVLVMGSEGKGLRRLTREVCDVLVAIPMAGQIESLNVSVATGILLYNCQSRRGMLDFLYTDQERL